MSDARYWYVVHTQPHCEERALGHLLRQGFSAYLPRHLRQRRHARKTEIVARPLFPRYLFVNVDRARERWRPILSTVGVTSLVMLGEEPAPVPDTVIDEIRAREGRDGFVQLGLPAGVGPGSRVRILDGLFADNIGEVERIADERRVAILLSLLGREVRVFVPVANVGAA